MNGFQTKTDKYYECINVFIYLFLGAYILKSLKVSSLLNISILQKCTLSLLINISLFSSVVSKWFSIYFFKEMFLKATQSLKRLGAVIFNACII